MFGVYVHVPWCRSRCPYCAFAIDTRRAPDNAGWLAGVRADWARERPYFPGQPETLSFGGGTPSRADPAVLAAVVAEVAPRGEVSLEANPEDVTPALAAAWRAAGITRLSLGVQTFAARVAPRLGRAPSARQAREALATVRAAGFESVSVDLIFGLPEQTEAELLADVDEAADAGVHHLSLYSLTIEPDTVFARRARPTLDDEAWAARHEAAVARLSERGLLRYELSNFARPGHRSVHNEHYWRARRWAGLGPAAHGWRPDGTRTANAPDVATWLAGAPPTEERPAGRALLYELVWSTLRHVDGVDRAQVAALTGVPVIAPRDLVAHGLVDIDDRSIRLRDAGFAVSDSLAERIVDESVRRAARSSAPEGAYSRAQEPRDGP